MSTFVSRRPDGTVTLFIDGDLQFDQRDEKIYHEGLAQPALKLAEKRLTEGTQLTDPKTLKALIIGGGDGLTARELLKSAKVGSIDLVDYDPEVLSLARSEFAQLNANSLTDPRTTVHVTDAWHFVEEYQNQVKNTT
jgi:spermidine synthase